MVNLLTKSYKLIFLLMGLFTNYHVKGHQSKHICKMLTPTHYENHFNVNGTCLRSYRILDNKIYHYNIHY